MATIRSRGEIVTPTEIVSLRVQFFDLNGNKADLQAFPQITLVQPSGNVAFGPTSIGVYRQDVGLYGFDWTTSLASSLGVYTDIWQGVITTGEIITKELNFIVYTSQTPGVNTDGYVALGDDPGFHFSQNATRNINKVLKGVRRRLNSAGKTASKDQFGNAIYVDCDIFNLDTLITFVCQSLTMFNEEPHFTMFTWEDTYIIDQFYNVLVQGAVILALASQALIERGSEYNLSDNGISFTPPTVAELLSSQWSTELTNHTDKIKRIKLSMKPGPLGLGSAWSMYGTNPAIRRLQRLKQRRIL